MVKTHPLLQIVLPVMGYLAAISLFGNALLNPEDNTDFIYKVGIFIFLTEFLSLHSSVLLSSANKQTAARIFALCIYVILIMAFSFATGTVYPALVFIFSLFAKLFRNKEAGAEVVVSTFILMGALMVVVITSSIWVQLFKFPQNVLDMSPDNSSGMFVDKPQTLLIWGILYFTGLILWKIRNYKTNKKKAYHATGK